MGFLFMMYLLTANAWADKCQPWECSAELYLTSSSFHSLNLDEYIEVAPALGVGISFNYATKIEMDFRVQYAALNARSHDQLNIPLHLGLVEAGYSYLLWGRFSAGLGMHFLRAREELKRPMLLQDNESDFGHYLRWNTPSWKLGYWNFSLGLSSWSAWTKPNWSHFAGLELKGSWKWY